KALRLANANQARWQEILERETGNMRAAMKWLLERKKEEDVLRLEAALVKLWTLSEFQSQGYSFLKEILEVSKQNQGCISPTILKAEPLLPPSYADLTVREIEVLRLLATGLSNKLIAERLVLSPHTVNVHIHSIFSKLDVHSRSAATRYALDHQLA
ncbi:MAG TPA: response regulator transcription factor, partial [Ktedonobacteraceae bacterium]|nr:response regulator transcription factor [Ktedonobacteraceae bacterium]